MATKNNAKQPSKLKPVLMVVTFLVSLYLLIGGVMMASNWLKIRPYKALASELNQTLGGGYKIGYTWNCGLESTNCPSARMLKDANFKDNEEAETTFNNYISSMKAANFEVKGISICEPRAGFNVYCGMTAKKDGKTITFNAKQNFIGIDIQP